MAAKKTRRTTKTSPSGVQLGDSEVRTRVLQGAAFVFAERGVQAASVEDILNAAGVARRTFYRLYASKEGVMAALYRMGTDSLLGACTIAVSEGKTPLDRVTGCVDAHLRNARDFGRIVFVLGGEAHRPESLLYARRREVHDALVTLFAAATKGRVESSSDALLFRSLVLAIEGATRAVLEAGDEGRNVPDESFDEVREVMVRLVRAALDLG